MKRILSYATVAFKIFTDFVSVLCIQHPEHPFRPSLHSFAKQKLFLVGLESIFVLHLSTAI